MRTLGDQTSGTELIPIGPARCAPARSTPRPQAVFLVHLIATRRQAPQTRMRRRVDAREATAAYRAWLTRRIAEGSRLFLSA